jgi:tetratricopeptide (TPR) repeat protein
MGIWEQPGWLQASRLNAQGDWLINAGREEEAIRRFSEAISVAPARWNAYCKRGLSYLSLAQFHNALEDFSQCVAMEPEHPYLYLCRANAYLAMKNYPDCIRDCTKVLSLLAWSQDNLPDLYRKGDRTLERSHRFLAHVALARAELGSGNPESSLMHCNKAVAIEAVDFELYEVRAKVYEKLGSVGLAQQDLLKSEQIRHERTHCCDQRLNIDNVQPYSKPSLLLLKILSWLNQSNIPSMIVAVVCVVALLMVLRLFGLSRDCYWISQSDRNAAGFYGLFTLGFIYFMGLLRRKK